MCVCVRVHDSVLNHWHICAGQKRYWQEGSVWLLSFTSRSQEIFLNCLWEYKHLLILLDTHLNHPRAAAAADPGPQGQEALAFTVTSDSDWSLFLGHKCSVKLIQTNKVCRIRCPLFGTNTPETRKRNTHSSDVTSSLCQRPGSTRHYHKHSSHTHSVRLGWSSEIQWLEIQSKEKSFHQIVCVCATKPPLQVKRCLWKIFFTSYLIGNKSH